MIKAQVLDKILAALYNAVKLLRVRVSSNEIPANEQDSPSRVPQEPGEEQTNTRGFKDNCVYCRRRVGIPPNMYESICYFDLPVLMSKGFSFGIDDSVLWNTDRHGVDWQAIIDGQWIYFAEQLPSGARLGQRKMTHEEFHKLFI